MTVNYGDETPIAAFATNPVNSALALIRCSGRDSVSMASSVFRTSLKSSHNKLGDVPGNTVIHGWIVKTINNEQESETEIIDEVLVSVFRSPKSYTGEDSLDICCHGGPAAGPAVLTALKTAGFRDALPGEFTFRAFMNGKLDLTRCESVLELVCAKTETGRSRAVSRLCGSLEKEINVIKPMLVQVLAGAEIYLDYSEDEISAGFDTDAAEEIEGKLPHRSIAHNALQRLKKLAASWQMERIYQEGITIVIAGRPNTGKSSLFNALLREDRAIVTEIPGTTRDWIEAWVSIKGIPVRLIDTAGLRETTNSIEKMGVERSFQLLQEADLVLYLINDLKSARHFFQDDLNSVKGVRHLFIWNKCDIAMPPQPFPLEDVSPVCISAKTGEGLDRLYTAIVSAIHEQAASGIDFPENHSAALGTVRQKKLVDAACCALEEALELSDNDEPLDLIAPLLREAVNFLGEITGEVSTADIIEEMFSRFCVGK